VNVSPVATGSAESDLVTVRSGRPGVAVCAETEFSETWPRNARPATASSNRIAFITGTFVILKICVSCLVGHAPSRRYL
jgi:hypothetical protein